MSRRYVRGTPTERFWAYVEKTDTCWLWTGYRNELGYGFFAPRGSRNVRAYRWAYEEVYGSVPQGLELDHLCGVRACVRPTHLEPVTHLENVRRGRTATKTHCVSGHAFDDVNTYIKIDSRGRASRTCRTCRREGMKHSRVRRAAA